LKGGECRDRNIELVPNQVFGEKWPSLVIKSCHMACGYVRLLGGAYMNALSLFGMGESVPAPSKLINNRGIELKLKTQSATCHTSLGWGRRLFLTLLWLVADLRGERSGGWVPREKRRLSLKEM